LESIIGRNHLLDGTKKGWRKSREKKGSETKKKKGTVLGPEKETVVNPIRKQTTPKVSNHHVSRGVGDHGGYKSITQVGFTREGY